MIYLKLKITFAELIRLSNPTTIFHYNYRQSVCDCLLDFVFKIHLQSFKNSFSLCIITTVYYYQTIWASSFCYKIYYYHTSDCIIFNLYLPSNDDVKLDFLLNGPASLAAPKEQFDMMFIYNAKDSFVSISLL